jgi:hypothetical protein
LTRKSRAVRKLVVDLSSERQEVGRQERDVN